MPTEQEIQQARDDLQKAVAVLNHKFASGQEELTADRAQALIILNERAGNKVAAQAIANSYRLKVEGQDRDTTTATQDAVGVAKGLAGQFIDVAGIIGAGQGGMSPQDSMEGSQKLKAMIGAESPPMVEQIKEQIAKDGVFKTAEEYTLGAGAAGTAIGEVWDDPSVMARKPFTTTLRVLQPILGAVGGYKMASRPFKLPPPPPRMASVGIGGPPAIARESLRTRALNRRLAEVASLADRSKGARFQAPASTLQPEIEALQQLGGETPSFMGESTMTIQRPIREVTPGSGLPVTHPVTGQPVGKPAYPAGSKFRPSGLGLEGTGSPRTIPGYETPQQPFATSAVTGAETTKTIKLGDHGPTVSPPELQALDTHFENFTYETARVDPVTGGKIFREIHPGAGLKSAARIRPDIAPSDLIQMQDGVRESYLTKRWSVLDSKAAKADYGRYVLEGRKAGMTQAGVTEFAKHFQLAREIRKAAIQANRRMRGLDVLEMSDLVATMRNAANEITSHDMANAGKGATSGFSEGVKKATKGSVVGKLTQPINLFDHPLLKNMVPQAIWAEARMAAQYIVEKNNLRKMMHGLSKSERLAIKGVNEGINGVPMTMEDLGIIHGAERSKVIWDRAKQFRDWQDRLLTESGFDPELLGRDRYIHKIYEDSIDLAATIYDTHGGDITSLMGRTDAPVKANIVPGILRRKGYPEGLLQAIDDPLSVGDAFAHQVIRRKYFDPFTKVFNDDLLGKVGKTSPAQMALAADYLRDVLGYPTSKEIAVRLKIMGAAHGFLEKNTWLPQTARGWIRSAAGTSPRSMVNAVTGATFLAKMGLKIAFIPLNLLELSTNIPARLGYIRTAQGFVDYLNPWARGGKDLRNFMAESAMRAESPIIDTALHGTWRHGLKLAKDIAAFPVTFSERLNLNVASAAALRKTFKTLGSTATREQIILHTISELHKARPGFFRAARPQVLRRPMGRVLQQFNSYNYFISETIGKNSLGLFKSGSRTESAKNLAKLYVGAWASQAFMEGMMGLDMRGQVGLGWLPFVYYNRADGKWRLRDVGNMVAGPTADMLYDTVTNVLHITQGGHAQRQLMDPGTYDRLIQDVVVAYGNWARGDTPKEKIFGSAARKK